MAVVGSGIMAERLTDDVAVQLLANAISTGAALYVLITIFAPVSGASFNPVVTVVGAALGTARSVRQVVDVCALAFSQTCGAVCGSLLANAMFGRALFEFSHKVRTGGPTWFAEFVATLGLVVVVLGAVRSSQSSKIASLVAAWITGAYWFTSSTSLANPAVTVGRMFSDSFAGIAPGSVPMFVVMQCIGAVVASAVVALVWPSTTTHEHPPG